MATEVRMPKLGMSMKKGVVSKWLKGVGDEIKEGEDLLEISTDKINAVVQAPASGVLGKIVMQEKAFGPPGSLLGFIGAAGEAFPEVAEVVAPPATATTAPASEPSVTPAPVAVAEDVQASPAAKRLARELGVDLTRVPPSAPGKRLTTDDVERYAAARDVSAVEPAGKVIPFEGIRAVVAEHMHQSLATMAQVTITREVDAHALVAKRRSLAAGFEAATAISLSFTDLIVQVTAQLLSKHPLLNASLTDEGIVVSEEVHLGFAVALDNGLIVPVIRDADRKGLAEIARARVELADRALKGTIGLEEIEGGTFTITNLGSFGADAFTPIINPPQCAILGVGRIVERPVAIDGEVRVRPTMWLSLTFDHRVVDGAPAAQFLEALAGALESLA